QVYGTAIMPATAYVEMALAAGRAIWGDGPAVLEDILIHRPLILSEEQGQTVQLVWTPDDASVASFQIFSLDEAEATGGPETWRLHATGVVQAAPRERDA